MPFPARADTYPAKDPVADYRQAYADAFDLPVELNARVTHLSRTEEGFEVCPADQVFRPRQVVVATGPFQVPLMPEAAQWRGVTDVPGLYFLGRPWQHTRGSSLLGFVNDDAAYLADRIAAYRRATDAAVAS
jgi:cation diffusion facilitator CzcD-associated flavoprotein CzcO